jgi:hypothetical protein
MKSGKILALSLCLLLVLGLTFIIADTGGKSNGTVNKSAKIMNHPRQNNYGTCISNQTKIKYSCYKTKKEDFKTCEKQTRQFFKENRWKNSTSTMNRTELIRQTKQKSESCKLNYKSGLKQCKTDFNASRQVCEVWRNQSNHTFIPYKNQSNHTSTPPKNQSNHTYVPPRNLPNYTLNNCTCPAGYRKDGNSCNPECYYSTPPCLTPSVPCEPFRIQRPAILNSSVCTSGGGKWNECGSRCTIDNQGKEGIACPALCEALCECGTIAGLTCPTGYTCRMPAGVADAMGYCR